MKIIVPIKQVPETKSVRMDEASGTVIREGVESIVNPLDLYSIELALELKEKYAAETVAISMGPAKAVCALKEAVSMGIDSAVLLSDRAFAGSDTWATSNVLASAIRKIGGYSLIICGERAVDGDTGQVGPGVAAFLDISVMTYISGCDSICEDSIEVVRMIEDGYETLRCALPSVLTVVKEVSNPRLPTLRGKKRAKQMDIPVWGIDELGLDAESVGLKGSPTRVVKIAHPKITRQCEMIDAKDESGVALAVDSVCDYLGGKDFV